MIGPFTLVSNILLFLGGAMFALGATGWALVLTAIGAGWNGILFATMQRLAQAAQEGPKR